jgi:tetratricopeptide (TPR) repeat protein
MSQVWVITIGLGLAVAGWGQVSTNALTPAEVAQREFRFGQSFLQGGQYASAAEAFERASLLRPDWVEALQLWGAALIQLGRQAPVPQQQFPYYQLAAEKTGRAAQLRPKDKVILFQWGEVLTLVGDLPLEPAARAGCYQGAAEKYRLAAEAAAQDWEPYSRWGAVLAYKLPPLASDDKTRLQLYQNAADLFAKATERTRFSSETGPTLAHWGTVLARGSRHTTDLEQRKKLLRDSAEKFGKSARLRGGVASTYTLWGTALLELAKLTRLRSDYRDAAAQLSASLALQPNDPATLYTLAAAYALMDNSTLALETLRQCFAADANQTFSKAAPKDPDLAGLRNEPGFAELFKTDTRTGVPGYNPPLHNTPR